jgi:Tol biopolymer transport system component
LVGLPAVSTPPPPGELWLGCSDQTAYSIWRVRTDGSELTRVITLTYGPAWLFAWSRDGQRLAYVGSASVSVIDADGRLIKTYRPGLIGWLPGGRLWIIDAFSDDREKKSRVLNLDTGEDDEITGTYPVWSPDGTRVAYFVQDPSDATVWVADADGRNARALGSGYMATWSPDSRRIAFLSGLDTDPAEPMGQTLGASKVEIADVASGDVTTFARRSDVLRSLGQDDRQWTMGDVSWSPDGSRIAVSIGRTGARALAEPNFLLAVLDAATGAVRAQWRGEGMGIPTSWLSQRTWSPDGRYLVFAIPTDGTSGSFGDLNILDTDTGKTITVPGIGLWDWSPADGRKWLAIPQPGQGLLLLTLDLSAIHRLTNVPNCFSVAWRPGER